MSLHCSACLLICILSYFIFKYLAILNIIFIDKYSQQKTDDCVDMHSVNSHMHLLSESNLVQVNGLALEELLVNSLAAGE